MDSQTPIEILALPLPKAPEMVDLDPPQTDVHGGISITDATHPDGLLILLLSYKDQAIGDTVALYSNEEFIEDTIIKNISSDTPISIPPGSLNKGVNRIYFQVKRLSGNTEKTPELKLAYASFPPGDVPPELTLRLNLLSVDQSNADTLVAKIQYKNMQWYDWIYISCNGVLVPHRLVPNGDTSTTPVPSSVDIPITKKVLEQAGDDSTFEFKYRVTDKFNNKSGPPTWSESLSIPVNLSQLFLQAGLFREQLADNDDDPGIIERAKLKDDPLWLLVHLLETIWRDGDVLRYEYTAKKGDNTVASYSNEVPIKQVPSQQSVPIPNGDVVADSIATAVYYLKRGGTIIATSKTATAAVIGGEQYEDETDFKNGNWNKWIPFDPKHSPVIRMEGENFFLQSVLYPQLGYRQAVIVVKMFDMQLGRGHLLTFDYQCASASTLDVMQHGKPVESGVILPGGSGWQNKSTVLMGEGPDRNVTLQIHAANSVVNLDNIRLKRL